MASKPALVAQRESFLANPNRTEFSYTGLEEAFPSVDPGMKPIGTVGLFQIRHPKRRTVGSILLSDESRSTEYYNTQVGKVIALGDLCFKSVAEDSNGKSKIVDWPEGAWFKVGEYVRLPKYGGDRFSVPYLYEDFEIDPSNGRKEKVTVKDEIIFALFKVKDVIGVITGDPLKIRSFVD